MYTVILPKVLVTIWYYKIKGFFSFLTFTQNPLVNIKPKWAPIIQNNGNSYCHCPRCQQCHAFGYTARNLGKSRCCHITADVLIVLLLKSKKVRMNWLAGIAENVTSASRQGECLVEQSGHILLSTFKQLITDDGQVQERG